MNWKLILHSIFWIAYLTAFWGSFELAFKAAKAGLIESPIWSGTFGPPIFHHYIVGFMTLFVCWIISTYNDFRIVIKKKIKEVIECQELPK